MVILFGFCCICKGRNTPAQLSDVWSVWGDSDEVGNKYVWCVTLRWKLWEPRGRCRLRFSIQTLRRVAVGHLDSLIGCVLANQRGVWEEPKWWWRHWPSVSKDVNYRSNLFKTSQSSPWRTASLADPPVSASDWLLHWLYSLHLAQTVKSQCSSGCVPIRWWLVVSPVNTPTCSTSSLLFCCSSRRHSSPSLFELYLFSLGNIASLQENPTEAASKCHKHSIKIQINQDKRTHLTTDNLLHLFFYERFHFGRVKLHA